MFSDLLSYFQIYHLTKKLFSDFLYLYFLYPLKLLYTIYFIFPYYLSFLLNKQFTR